MLDSVEAPSDDTLGQQGETAPWTSGRIGRSGRGVGGERDVGGTHRARQDRWERELRRNDERPGPKSYGYPAICPASESHRISSCYKYVHSLSGTTHALLLSPTVSHSPCHTPSPDVPRRLDSTHARAQVRTASRTHARPWVARPPPHPPDLRDSSDLRPLVIVTSYTSAL